MHAHTPAIEHAGNVLAGSADHLAALAATLPQVADSAPALFGPIADTLVAALRDAVADTTLAVARLGENLSIVGTTAGHIAGAYADAEHRVGQSISAIGH